MSGLLDHGSRLTHGEAVLGFAEEVGVDGPVAVEGGRTRWDCGGPPAPDSDVRLVKAPAGIVQYKPDEMIIRAGAGTSVADLNEAMLEHGQRSALPDRGGSVGGAIAVGESDRDVLGRGAIRTALLQVTYVSAEGKVVSGGGPTVKNVSGFDLPRLMVGSLGTLGCLAEVIIRTNPIPPTSRWFSSSADPFDIYDAVLAPAAVLWDGTTTWLHLEGHEADVDAEAERAAVVGELSENAKPPTAPGPHRWSLAPAALRRVSETIEGAFLASVGVGTVLAAAQQPHRPLSTPVQEIHDRMKIFFDPTGRLNPGRHPARK